MGRRNDHSREQLRELAICAAEQLICAEGLAGLSARKIAARIGYSPGSLYVAFENLDDIVLNVNARTLALLHAAIAAIEAQPAEPEHAIEALAEAYLQFATEHNNRWRCVFEHRMPTDMRVPRWYLQRVGEMFAVVSRPIAYLNPQLDETGLRRAARALWSAVHGVCILGFDDKLDLSYEDDVTDVLRTLVQTYGRGLRP